MHADMSNRTTSRAPRQRVPRRQFLMASLLALGAPATALQRPSGKVALTLRGKVQTTNQGGQAVFDLAMLAELPQKQFTGMTHWEKTPLKFGGPLLRDVFAAAQVTGTQVHATASDGYRVSFPAADATRFDMLIATRVNDRPIPLRSKGPLWLVYPFGSDPKLLEDKIYTDRSIWHLSLMEIE